MQHVRAFGKLVDPADYRRGYGFRGFWTWLLNFVRVFFERAIVLNILRLEARRSGASKSEEKELITEALRDPDVRPWLGISPPKKKPLVRRTVQPLYNTAEERTEARYREGRKNNNRVEPKRPLPIEDGEMAFTISVADNHRSTRYVRGRRRRVITEDSPELGLIE